jgi:hypothetical protein
MRGSLRQAAQPLIIDTTISSNSPASLREDFGARQTYNRERYERDEHGLRRGGSLVREDQTWPITNTADIDPLSASAGFPQEDYSK